jgi:hypothetical protein
VTLTATPFSGTHSWNGSAVSRPAHATIDGDKVVMARFAPVIATLMSVFSRADRARDRGADAG